MSIFSRSPHPTAGDASAPAPPPTPIYITPRTRLILIITTFVVVYLLAAAAPSIPRLLILGAIVALILSFPVRVLSGWMSRKWATFVAVGSTILLSLLFLLLLIPFLISEISEFLAVLPKIFDDTRERRQQQRLQRPDDHVLNRGDGGAGQRVHRLTVSGR